jgi:putative transposase
MLTFALVNFATLRFRIKDSSCSGHLQKMAWSVNDVWNYCNEVNQERWKKFRKTFSGFDLNKLTAGCSKELGIDAQSIQAVCDEYDKSRRQHKKIRLSWRSRKSSLGWVPFKSACVKIDGDTIRYRGQYFRLWLSRPIPGEVRCGSFNQDSQGRWYVSLVVEVPEGGRVPTGNEVGIDLGLKTLATLSDGVEYGRENLTKAYEDRLAKAQRARKRKRVTAMHAKIKNKRNDWSQKVTTEIVRTYDKIVVGNVNSSKLKKTRMAKSVSDAGWYAFKTMLAYKAKKLGIVYEEVNESFSTVTCSICKAKTGPKGIDCLGVREWVCTNCGTSHDRDVNAAKNILSFSVQDIERC